MKAKQILTTIIILLLWLLPATGAGLRIIKPHSGECFQFDLPDLAGYTAILPISKFNWNNWTNQTFQNNFEIWFSANFGIRNILIRLNNQILYSCFRRSYMGGMVIGNWHILNFPPYIADHFHNCTPLEKNRIINLVAKLSKLQTFEEKRGIPFVFLITPSKPEIQSEYIPYSSRQRLPTARVYNVLVDQLRKAQIHYIDGHIITAKIESSKELQTFPKGASHWTEPTAVATLNAVIREMNMQKHNQFSEILTKALHIDAPFGEERDLWSLLNLLDIAIPYKVQHGIFSAANLSSIHKGHIVISGDSFIFALTGIANKAHIFKSIDHFYYYPSCLFRYPGSTLITSPALNDIDWDKDVLNCDAVIIEINEAFINNSLNCTERFVDTFLDKCNILQSMH